MKGAGSGSDDMGEDSKRIVIVDDEEDIVLYLSAILTDHGYQVSGATDGRQGLEAIRTLRPDLVCLDILMPGETGASLYRKIRSDRALKKIPVLIISGMNRRDGVLAEQVGADNGLAPPEGYLEKPVQPEQFLDLVRKLVKP